MQKHQNAGAGSNSTDANDLDREAVLVEVDRVAIGQVHVPRAVGVGGNGRAGPEISTIDFRLSNPIG